MPVEPLRVSPGATVGPSGVRSPADPRWGVVVGFGALSLATHAASLGFTVAGGRLLPPAAFGTLIALLGVILVGLAPGMAVQALTAAGTLGRPVTVDRRLARRLAVAIAVVVGLLVVVLGPAIGSADVVTVAGTAVAAGLLPLTAANEGLLQGRRRFLPLGAVLLVGALVKLAAGVVGMAATRTVASAAGAIALGWAVQLALSRTLAGDEPPSTRDGGVRLDRVVVTTVVMMGLLLVIVHVDAVLARALLPDLESGRYAVGAAGARVVFWTPQFAMLLVFPRLVQDHRRRLVAAVTGGLVLVGAVGAVVASAVGPWLVGVVYGEAYVAIGDDLWRFAWLGCAALGMQLLTLTDVARGRHDAAWLLLATLATTVLAVLLASPASAAALVTLVAGVVSAFAVLGVVRRLLQPDARP